MQLSQWSSQLKKGALALGVLLILKNKSYYGLELVNVLQGKIGLDIQEGTIYPLLHRLSKEGLVTAEWVTENSRHPRKYYRLTKKGHNHLKNMIVLWEQFSNSVNLLINEGENPNVDVPARSASTSRKLPEAA